MERDKTPRGLGFRMPAEWEAHCRTWLTWPRRDGISFDARYDEILPTYLEMIAALLEVEPVHLNVWDEATEHEAVEAIRRAGGATDRLTCHRFPAYEPWCRDHGPIFVTREHSGRGEKAVIDWEYNAWGGKYPPYDLDNAIPRRIAEWTGLPCFEPGMVLEGGSIDVNGHGLLLTTEACLLNPNRNPGLSKREIEEKLMDYLGVRKVLWLGDGIAGDDTDGHVDDITRFLGERTVVTILEDDSADKNYPVLQENYARLSKMRDLQGRPLEIVTLPTPGHIAYDEQRLPASYANFYIANGLVIVPVFDHPNDKEALKVLRRAFPKRRVIGVDAKALIWGLGAFHCLTQQEPV